jgi:hypothetical protein
MTPYRDSEALDILRRGLPEYLYSFARTTGISADDALDLAQSILDELFNKLHALRAGDNSPRCG